MKKAYLLLALTAGPLLLSGCATKRYGRLQPVTYAEQEAYDCQDIEVEIAKVEAFRQQVAEGSQINGASVMGFLGDFGIGNANEKNAAEETAANRMSELLALRAKKRCGSAFTKAATTPEQAEAQRAGDVAKEEAHPASFGNSNVHCETCRTN